MARRRLTKRSGFGASAGFGIVSFASVALIALVSAIATARLYGVEVVGAYALAYAPVGICMALSTMQEQAALGRELATLQPRAPRVTGMFFAVGVFSAGLTLVAGLIVLAVAAVLFTGPIDRPELLPVAAALLGGYLLFDNTSWNLDMVFAAFRAGRALFWVRLAHALGFLLIASALSFVLDDVWGLALAQIGTSAVAVALRLVEIRGLMRLRVPRAELRRGRQDLPTLLRFGVRLAPNSIAEGVVFEAGTWIVGITSPIAAVGAWSRAWYVSRRLLEPAWRVGEVLLPTLVQHRHAGRPADFERTLVDAARYLATGLLLLAAAGGGAAEGVMALFGPGFPAAADALAILLVMPALYSVGTLQTNALIALERPGVASAITAVTATLVVAAGVALSAAYGVTGLAAAYVGGYVFDLVARTIATWRHMSGSLRALWRPMTALALVPAYAAGFAAARVIDDALGLLGVFPAVAGGALAFALVLVLMGGVPASDRARIGAMVKQRFPRPAASAER